MLIFQILFLGVYELFLKKETFFSLNRIYLLATPFLAAIIPFLEIEILQTVVPTLEIVQLPVLFLSEVNSQTNAVADGIDGSFSTYSFLKANALTIAYFLGALLSLALLARKFLYLQNLKKIGKIENLYNVNIVRIPKSRVACSFFNTIFLGEKWSEEETKQILAHELAHVEQKHSWDLLWFEILRILLWFNPFIYRQQSQLSILHEYIADEKVTQNSEKTAYFQELLNATFGTRQISFTNQFFNKSLIKKRILMLQKPKSNRNAKLKYLLVLPLMFLMLTYVSCSEYSSTLNEQEIALPKPPPPPPAPPSPFDASEIPLAVIDQAPIFPGCESLSSKEAKSCITQKITEFVNANFNTGLATKLGLSGLNRIQVLFKINENGEVVEVKARASKPELEREAIRVVEMLPDMIPGKQNGKAVSVLYSLPIVFKVKE